MYISDKDSRDLTAMGATLAMRKAIEALFDFLNLRSNQAYPCNAKWALVAGVSVATVQRAKQLLIKAGWLTVERRIKQWANGAPRQISNLYTFIKHRDNRPMVARMNMKEKLQYLIKRAKPGEHLKKFGGVGVKIETARTVIDNSDLFSPSTGEIIVSDALLQTKIFKRRA